MCKKAKQRPVLLDYFSVFVLRSINHFCYQLDTSSFLKLISATIIVFQIKQVSLTWDLNRLDAAVLSLTRENGDSTTLDVRNCFQCSRGKSYLTLITTNNAAFSLPIPAYHSLRHGGAREDAYGARATGRASEQGNEPAVRGDHYSGLVHL